MSHINLKEREVSVKIVYYGPALGGKTTNLQHIFDHFPARGKGKLLKLKTDTDSTLFFDFLPLEAGTVRGFKIRFQLYTVPGQVYHNATRRLVLRGTDGIVFVADSQPASLEQNIESLANLQENLAAHNLDLAELPLVLQLNKRDLPEILPVEEMLAPLNFKNEPVIESVATVGYGVRETLQAIGRQVLARLRHSQHF